MHEPRLNRLERRGERARLRSIGPFPTGRHVPCDERPCVPYHAHPVHKTAQTPKYLCALRPERRIERRVLERGVQLNECGRSSFVRCAVSRRAHAASRLACCRTRWSEECKG